MAEPSQPAAPGLRLGADVGALPTDGPGIGPDQQGEGAQKRGLAAAVAAGGRQKLAGAQGDGQVVEAPPAAAAASEVRYLEERGRHRRRRSMALWDQGAKKK